jgi:quercetin dioxygenase-like cupin family protein
MDALAPRIARRLRHGGRLPRLRSQVHALALPLPHDPATGWRPHHLFRGSARSARTLACHVSVLEPGHTPHPPHRHADEELLTVLDGEAELVLPDGTHRLERGALAYYPSGFAHTIRNVSDRPVTYLLLKWNALPLGPRPLGHAIVPLTSPATPDAIAMAHVLEGPTRRLGALRIHTTALAPGAGYAPHADPYDVALLVLDGQVETLGRTLGPNAVVLYAAGEPHGMRNTGGEPARYLVVELHPRGARTALRQTRARLGALRRRR